MSVPFDYYRKLNQEAESYIKKYKERNLLKRFKSFQPDEIRYERLAKKVSSFPLMGHFDDFFYCKGLRTADYKKGVLLKKIPQNASYWEFRLKDGKLVFGTFHFVVPCYYQGAYEKAQKNIYIYYYTGNGFVYLNPKSSKIEGGYFWGKGEDGHNRYFEFVTEDGENYSVAKTFCETHLYRDRYEEYSKNCAVYKHSIYKERSLDYPSPYIAYRPVGETDVGYINPKEIYLYPEIIRKGRTNNIPKYIANGYKEVKD